MLLIGVQTQAKQEVLKKIKQQNQSKLQTCWAKKRKIHEAKNELDKWQRLVAKRHVSRHLAIGRVIDKKQTQQSSRNSINGEADIHI